MSHISDKMPSTIPSVTKNGTVQIKHPHCLILKVTNMPDVNDFTDAMMICRSYYYHTIERAILKEGYIIGTHKWVECFCLSPFEPKNWGEWFIKLNSVILRNLKDNQNEHMYILFIITQNPFFMFLVEIFHSLYTYCLSAVHSVIHLATCPCRLTTTPVHWCIQHEWWGREKDCFILK